MLLSFHRKAELEAKRCSSSFENMPFLHVEDALLGARRACCQILIVTCWFVEGYTVIYRECHSINVRVFRLVDCNVFSYLYQHLTPITQHPTEAVTVCDICMPEAFCEFETVRKKVLLNLWVLWEKKLPSELFVCYLIEWVRSISHRKTQKNRTHSISQRH